MSGNAEIEAVAEAIDHLDHMERWLAERIGDLVRVLAQPVPRVTILVQNAAMMMSRHVSDFEAELTRLERLLGTARAALTARADAPGAPPAEFQRLSHRLMAARQMSKEWLIAHRLVLAQAEYGPVPLYTPEAGQSPMAAALEGSGDRLFEALHRIHNALDQDEAAAKTGAFADISYPLGMFLTHAHGARRLCLARGDPPPYRFLDVGCGAGLKVLAAQQIFECADGIELDPGYAGLARALLAKPAAGHGAVFEGDALTFDRYDSYDAIYFFQPIRDADRLKALERKIVTSARPGTVIIAPYPGFAGRFADYGCTRFDGSLYGVGLTAEATEALHLTAQYTGPAVRRWTGSARSPWEPLFAISFRNGFAA